MDALWQTIKKYYSDTFSISGEIVEMMAADNILLLAASGTSNEKISNVLDINIDSVSDIIVEYFSTDSLFFSGWDESLSINPFAIYQNIIFVVGVVDFETFLTEVLSFCPDILEYTAYIAYSVSKVYFNIDIRLQKEWK